VDILGADADQGNQTEHELGIENVSLSGGMEDQALVSAFSHRYVWDYPYSSQREET